MDTSIKRNASGSGEAGSRQARWKSVRKGLRLNLLGSCLALLIAGPGAALVWGSQSRWAPDLKQRVSLSLEQIAGLGWVLLGAGLVLAYVAVLGGQWRCLRHASLRFGARKLLLACVLCGLAWPVCLLVALLLGVDIGKTFALEAPQGAFLEFVQGRGAVLLAAVTLLLLNFLLFNGFLGTVAKSLAPSQLAWVAGLFWMSVFLVGGTAGLMFTPHAEVAKGLAIGWGLYLLWQAVLVRGASRWIDQALTSLQRASGQHRVDRDQKTKPYSGLRRYTVQVQRD